MCSFPGLPEVGSNTTVHITRVNLNPHTVLVEFGGSLNNGQENREAYQHLKKDLEIPRKRQHAFEGKPGEVCLVYEDGTWHRARILSKSEHECKVFLIDDGKLLWVSSEVLTKCPHNLCSVPPKVELCILASASALCLESAWSVAASTVIRSLCGKDISGCVQDVIMPSRIIILDIPSLSKQMYELGFARKMPNKDFKNLVMHSLHLPRRNPSIQTDLVTTNGQQEHASDPDKLHQYLYPELLSGAVEIVTVTQVIHPLKIYCKLHVFSQELKKLSDQLHEYYENSFSVQMPMLLYDGSPCATKGSDGKWYRSVLQQNNVSDVVKKNGMVQVRFIDFGNEATLLPLKIRQLGKQFLSTPRFSIHCTLEDGRRGKRDWTQEEIMTFKKAAGENGEKTIQCKFIQKDASAWIVSLELGEGPLFNAVLKPGAQPESQMHCSEGTQPLAFKDPAVTQGQIVDAYASSIVGPNYFWCQFKNSEELDTISLLAQEIGNSSQTKPIQPDQLCHGPCLALFSDQLWYRAQVINTHSKTVSVLFIDYGNESEIDLNFVKSLPTKLLESPPEAFLCQLDALGSVDGTWSDAAADKFFELLVDEPLKVTIQNTVMSSDLSNCPHYNVLVECNGLIVNDLMKDYWFAAETQEQNESMMVPELSVQCLPQAVDLPPRMIEPGKVSEVYVSHINSLTSFFAQLVEDEKTLFSLTELLNSHQPSEKDDIHASSVQQGSLVKAMFPEDDSWYRAVVKDTTQNGMIQVEFIDFGNEATVSLLKIRRLDEQLLSYPRFSIHCSCSLDDQFKMQKGMEQTFLFKKIFGEAGENMLSCKFIKEDGITWEVKMTPSGSSSDSNEKWDSLDVNASPVVSEPVKETFQLLFKKPDVSLGQTVEAFASCIVGPDYFWCQFSNSEILDQITLVAQEYGNSSETQLIKVDNLDPGSLCLARFCDDQMWYRAQVINKCTNVVSVLFVDFGNESETSEGSVKALPCDLLESPPQAFLCQLEGFGPSKGSWDSAATDNFYELLVDKPLKVTVQCIDSTTDPNPPYYVKVESPQCLVNELMMKFWSGSAQNDQNSSEVIESCEKSIASTSDRLASEDKTSVSLEISTEDMHTIEPHGAEQHGADQIELLVKGDLHGVPEKKVADQLDGADVIAAVTNSDVIADDPTGMNLDLEIHEVCHESDEDNPVVSTEQVLRHTEKSRKDIEHGGSEKGLCFCV
uniref:Si:ch211-189e2.3 n=1 Tax=Sinocyclocheilus anshuiensis TaxID=1608454 RepID=A0A671N6M7_9TELE